MNMKDNKQIQSFRDFNENLNSGTLDKSSSKYDVSESKTIRDIIDDKTKDSNGFFWGVFGDTMNFFIADKEFNVVFETPAFHKGHWTNDVKDAMKKFGIDDVKSRMRTDNNIEELKKSIDTEYKIWKMYSDRTKQFYFH